ncbi:GTP-binding protein [Aureisphaera sp. CAU 1614]|uniref:GTP-binding protein n=1 Tax=Halomarinibacterium sedimenti TaxID=2857106 RepID=A0A9X1JXN7_9FLAO|nr:GTP-binding protein [Halomarinibacterium sedimenti]MBW2936752.1 GTP-binding protein [Halomarinibacterium sedimenti]
MELGEEIVLRPRFTFDLKSTPEEAIKAFEAKKNNTEDIVITHVDHHVFLKIPKHLQHFWSPQLDLEITSFEEGKTTLRGLFGPKPAVWTMFMFFHFAVASLFIAFGIWAYTNASLDSPYLLQLVFMGLMVITWFVLYFAGRMGKQAGKKEMLKLYGFMKQTLQL